MPVMPKILPWLPLVLAINSQLLIAASAHLRGRWPCVFLLCSLMTLKARLLPVWRLLLGLSLLGVLLPRLRILALQVSA